MLTVAAAFCHTAVRRRRPATGRRGQARRGHGDRIFAVTSRCRSTTRSSCSRGCARSSAHQSHISAIEFGVSKTARRHRRRCDHGRRLRRIRAVELLADPAARDRARDRCSDRRHDRTLGPLPIMKLPATARGGCRDGSTRSCRSSTPREPSSRATPVTCTPPAASGAGFSAARCASAWPPAPVRGARPGMTWMARRASLRAGPRLRSRGARSRYQAEGAVNQRLPGERRASVSTRGGRRAHEPLQPQR